MTLFLDSADLTEISKIKKWGVIQGITTNPKIFAKLGNVDFEETIRTIAEMTDHLSVELTKVDQSNEALIDEAQVLHAIHPESICIKVPMWGDGRGLEIATKLIKQEIPVNMTCLMGAHQAILAAEAGCEYISLFYNRMADYLSNRRFAQYQFTLLRSYIDDFKLDSKIIAGSIRDPKDIVECLDSGTHIVTVPYKHLIKMPHHIRTEETIAEFDQAWRDFKSR